MGITKYAEIIRIDLIEKATYIWEQLVLGGIIAILIFIFVHVWTAIYAGKTTIEGFTLAQMVWYLAVTETIMFSQSNDMITKIGEDVRSGAVGISLLKPLNYAGKEFMHVLSGYFFKIITIGAIALAVAQAMVGMISLELSTLPFFFVVSFLGCILNFCIICSLGLSAFWFEDSKSVYFIYQKVIFILGGMLVPLEVYPVWMQGILTYLPTTYLIYAPAKLFVAFSWELFWQTLGAQLCWLVIMGFVLSLVYRRALGRVTLHGG